MEVEPKVASPEPEAVRVRAAPAPVVRRSLVVGSANDPLEAEADRVAARIVAATRQPITMPDGSPDRVRRAVHPMSASTAPPPRVQRKGWSSATVGAEGGAVDTTIESRIQSARGRGRPMPADVGERMQGAFGADFSNVRLHQGAESSDLNRSIQAQAFTTQSDVFLGEGTPSLTSEAGTRLLAHELTHVVQQTGGAQRSMRESVSADSDRTVRRLTVPGDTELAQEQARAAMKEHRADRARLMKIVRKGAKSSHRRTRNACEWILDGRTKLYALNATGDRDQRIAHLGHAPATTETWFPKGDGGAGDLQTPVAGYNPMDLDDQTNITVDTDDGPITNGWNGNGFIAVMMGGGKMSEKAVLETLRHEVQHDADKNREKSAAAVAIEGDVAADAQGMSQSIEGYKTEYRAYNYEGSRSYMRKSPTKVVTQYGYSWTERQLAIFVQIHGGYDHTQQAWDNSYLTVDWQTANPGETEPDGPSSKDAFHHANITDAWKASIKARQMAIVGYVNPDNEGFNKYDSVRVDDFYQALDAIPVGTSDSENRLMTTLMWKTGFLGQKDAAYVLVDSPDMRKKMKAHLIGDAYVAVHKLLCAVAKIKKAPPTEQVGKSESKYVREFSAALDEVPVGTADAGNPKVLAMLSAATGLKKAERKQLRSSETRIMNTLSYRLSGAALAAVENALQD